jgi:type III secretory pathway component EscS
VATVLSVAVPVGTFVLMVYALHTWLVRQADPFHLGLLAGTAAVLVAAVWLAAAGCQWPGACWSSPSPRR